MFLRHVNNYHSFALGGNLFHRIADVLAANSIPNPFEKLREMVIFRGRSSRWIQPSVSHCWRFPGGYGRNFGRLGPVSPCQSLLPLTPNKLSIFISQESHCNPSSFDEHVVMFEARFEADHPVVSVRSSKNTDIRMGYGRAQDVCIPKSSRLWRAPVYPDFPFYWLLLFHLRLK